MSAKQSTNGGEKTSSAGAKSTKPAVKSASKPPAQAVTSEVIDDFKEASPLLSKFLTSIIFYLSIVLLAVASVIAIISVQTATQDIELWGMTSSGHVFPVRQLPEDFVKLLSRDPKFQEIVNSSQ
jgi:hypothetical protein